MWKDMFKLLPLHTIGKERFSSFFRFEFCYAFVLVFFVQNLRMERMEKWLLFISFQCFFMGWTSLFVRRLRDAGLLSILGLLPYGWCILFWLLIFGVSSSEREGIEFLPLLVVCLLWLLLLLCAFFQQNNKSILLGKRSLSKCVFAFRDKFVEKYF